MWARICPFLMVTGFLHIVSHSATDLITSLLNSSTRHQRWSVPPTSFLQTGHGIVLFKDEVLWVGTHDRP